MRCRSLGTKISRRAGEQTLEQCIELAQAEGRVETAGCIFSHGVGAAVSARQYDDALTWSDRAFAYCSERGLELYRFYALGYRARAELDLGQWDDAAKTAAIVLRIRRASILPRICGLVVLVRRGARRGDPGYKELLNEAWRLGEPTRELARMGPVAAARAEVAWVKGDRDGVVEGTERPFQLAVDSRNTAARGELALWRRRAGIEEEIPSGAGEPFAAQLTGDWARAAAFWDAAGCPYEAALALADARGGAAAPGA